MIREARFLDIPRLGAVMEEMHGRSRYAAYGLDLEGFKNQCVQAIEGHGQGTCLFVADGEQKAEGFILGVTDAPYGVIEARYATDLFFYVTLGADPHHASRLYDAFLAWAQAAPGVIEIRNGAVDAISDYRRTERLYQRKGLTQEGVLYRMETNQ